MEGKNVVSDFVGNWTYRSFENKPALDTPAEEVLLVAGDLRFEIECADDTSMAESDDTYAGLEIGCDKISGQLFFGELNLTVSGTVKSGDPPTIRFRATGVEDTFTAGWIYDYLGYRAPSWPKGEAQRPAIVGTLIRTVAHVGSGGVIRPANYTLSFIAVLRD